MPFYVGSGSVGRGGGLLLRTPPDEFSNASRAGAEAARDAAITNVPATLAEFNDNPNLGIILTITGTDPDTTVYQARRSDGWADVTLIARGPGPTDQQVAGAVQAGVKPYARIGGPVVPEPEIDAAIARDNEITQDFLLNVLGLTAQELNDLFVGALVSGAGAGRVITVTQADGSTVTLPVPDTGDGGGGEGGSADGVVSNVVFAADGTTLTLTLSTGGTLSASVPAALRQAGLSQSQVQALIDAAEADDVSTADVAAQIATELAAYRRLPGIVEYSTNTIIPASRRGWTYRATGNTTRLLSIPNASGVGEVPDGFEFVASNGSSADQSISPNGADTIDGNAGLTLKGGRTVRLQKIQTGAWIIIADTKDDAAGVGGADATARAAAQAAQRTADGKQDPLTTAQLIGFLQFDVVPSAIVGYTAAGQPADWLTDWRIWVSGGDTVGDVWMSMSIEGLRTGATPAPSAPGADLRRHKLSATNIYNFTFENANRTTLVDGRLARRQGRDIEIDLMFHDAASGGNLLDIVTVAVDWLGPPNPGVQRIVPAANAVVARADTAGVVDLVMNRAVTLNISGGANGDSMLVRAIQDGTGNRVLSLQAAIQREGRAAPVLSTAANAVDYLYFHRRGNTWVYLGIIKAG